MIASLAATPPDAPSTPPTNPPSRGGDRLPMVWFRIDDGFWRHGKVRRLGRQRVLAVGVWSLCGDWSSDNLTDGFVPWEVVESWDPQRKSARRLLDAGLWEDATNGDEHGIQFHDWADSNPTRDQVIQRRQADADRRARWREVRRKRDPEEVNPETESRAESRRDATRDKTRDKARESQRESRTGSVLPDPARPDPSSSLVPLGKNGGGSERPRCDQHRDLDPDDPGPNCVRCRDARLAAETRQPTRRRALRDACQRCDEAGWLLGDDGKPLEPARKCDHPDTS